MEDCSLIIQCFFDSSYIFCSFLKGVESNDGVKLVFLRAGKKQKLMIETVTTYQELAKKLAQVAINIRDNIKSNFAKEGKNGHLQRNFQELKDVLFDDITVEAFADMYAQTVTHGLLSLRIFQSKEFKLEKFLKKIPITNPILTSFLQNILGFGNAQSARIGLEDLGINDLIQILKISNIETVISDLDKKRKFKDPLIHFYEEFLHYYDHNQKVERGVFYTPDAVVSFIVRSINTILQEYFDCEDGIADEAFIMIDGEKVPKIQLLDPTTGTGTFINHIIDLTYEIFKKKHEALDKKSLQQKWNSYVSDNLLTRIFGLELLMAPYTIAHLKLGLRLRETGYTFQDQKRLRVYLANALEGPKDVEEKLSDSSLLSGFLLKESEIAHSIKTTYPISVVLGNPPYSGHSANNSQWIDDLLRGRVTDSTRISNYFKVDGETLGEKNPKWLNDDYVKFIRFGQWRIEKTGYGILAYITNHSFLDNPTFRGMRQELMKTFTDIFILDLHGNTRRKEHCPDGSKDENVFDIQQGACISFFIKRPERKGETNIFRFDIWGLREKKYTFLENNDISTIDWKKINSFSPWYMYYQLDMNRWEEYKSGWKITDIFPIHSVGIMTGQDEITIQDSPLKVQEIITDLILLPETHFRKKHKLKKDKRQWELQKAVNDIKDHGLNQNLTKNELNHLIRQNIVPILYRPFDKRYTFYTGKSRGFHERPRGKVMRHIINSDNLGLIISRNSRPAPWRDIQITENIIELGVMATRPGNNAPIFPLFLFIEGKKGLEKEVNFSNEFKGFIEEIFHNKDTPSPQDIVRYIYALLHSKEYRRRYDNFLKIDFPHILFSRISELFDALTKAGNELIDLHLMRSEILNDHNIRLRGKRNASNGIIKKLHYTSNNKLRINEHQYFEGIPREVYDFYIGGYQVCRKWLNDHKHKVLSKQDVIFFGKIVMVIQETIRLMDEIDQTIKEHGDWSEVFFTV